MAILKTRSSLAATLTATLYLCAHPCPTQAAEQQDSAIESSKYYINLDAGFAIPSDSNVQTRFTMGGGGGYLALENLGVGAFYSYSSKSISQSLGGISVATTNRIHLFGAEARYFLMTLNEGFNFGLKTGLAAQKGEATVTVGSTTVAAGASSTDFLIGPTAGYDHPLLPRLSVGAQVDALYITSSNFLMLQMLGTIRYFF